jgi:hypothetical protein
LKLQITMDCERDEREEMEEVFTVWRQWWDGE